MKKTTEHALTKWEQPDAPSWARARKYAEQIRGGAEAIVGLGLELAGLRKHWFAQGGSGRFGSPHPAANREKNTSPQGAAKCSHGAVKGWQERVREELGISDDTARRWIERAETIVLVSRLQAGQAVSYWDNRGEQKTIEPSAEISERAGETLEQIVTGAVAAPRAWAGLVGEGSRRAAQGGSAGKAPTNHAKNIRDALVKLRTSLAHWRRLDPDDRVTLEKMWVDVRESLPETWEA